MLQGYVWEHRTMRHRSTVVVNSKQIEGVHKDKKAIFSFLIASLEAKGEFNKISRVAYTAELYSMHPFNIVMVVSWCCRWVQSPMKFIIHSFIYLFHVPNGGKIITSHLHAESPDANRV